MLCNDKKKCFCFSFKTNFYHILNFLLIIFFFGWIFFIYICWNVFMSECIQIQILYKYEFEGKNISLRGNIMSDAKPLWWLNYMAFYKLRKNKNSSKNNKYFFTSFIEIQNSVNLVAIIMVFLWVVYQLLQIYKDVSISVDSCKSD